MNEPSIHYFPRIDENSNNTNEIIINSELQTRAVNPKRNDNYRNKKIFITLFIGVLIGLILLLFLFYIFTMIQIRSMVEGYFKNVVFQYKNNLNNST